MTSVENRSVSSIQNPDMMVGMKARGINLLKIYHTPYVDTTGIPLSSDRRHPSLVADIDFEYQSCPFSGSPSRYPNSQPHQTPLSGLERRRLGENYVTMQATMNDLRGQYIRLFRDGENSGDDPMTVTEMQQFLRALIFLPHYLVQRGENPVPAKGALSPSVIALSNSSAGVLAALESFLQVNQKDQNNESLVPDPSAMIEAAEKVGHMVGPKTVCAASPALMRHFIGAVVYGVDKNTRRNEFPVLDETEAESLFAFGPLAYLVHEEIGAFSMMDTHAAWMISIGMRNDVSRQQIREEIRGFRAKAQPVLDTLHQRETQLNQTLGRYPRSEKLTLDSFEIAGFKMPGVMRKIYTK